MLFSLQVCCVCYQRVRIEPDHSYCLSREGRLFKQITLMIQCGHVAGWMTRLRRHPATHRPMALTLPY
ncbi:hypothetical protein A628_02267 [Salmonella enterica subsp. enterica serovar Cubana str. 76814]|uniref:Uncharacterized protein n=1 Tax=Salmonella enterica subsp. enterica serovar Cubana str. 76814 TaxID=1192560 RepID=V7IP56_SALET|nr:hypothetical protein A628_02267 [Salmonella enterica subsp. enterica serovar Cubana str. 76814]